MCLSSIFLRLFRITYFLPNLSRVSQPFVSLPSWPIYLTIRSDQFSRVVRAGPADLEWIRVTCTIEVITRDRLGSSLSESSWFIGYYQSVYCTGPASKPATTCGARSRNASKKVQNKLLVATNAYFCSNHSNDACFLSSRRFL